MKTKLRKYTIGLVQINNSFSGQEYLPLSIGMLQAYIEKHYPHSDRLDYLLPIYNRVPVKTAANKLSHADIVFFSVYIWNYRISLEIARKLKAVSPEMLIVFGGPQVPDKAEDFLRKYPFVNVACHGEGEKIALAILKHGLEGDWAQVPGISYVSESGLFVKNKQLTANKNLSEYPSPYLNGVFDPLIKEHPDVKWMALWETNRGCPFSCSFCDWGSGTKSQVRPYDLKRIYKEWEWFSDQKIEFVYCCDANFGLLKRDIEIAEKAAEIKKAYGFPKRLSVLNTKNVTERAYAVQKTLSKAGLSKGVDLALQSLDKQTLKNVNRSNVSVETYIKLQEKFTNDGIHTYSDLILGLPGETYDSFVRGYSTIIENGQHNRIRCGPLVILPNAEMGDPAYQKKYGMITIESDATNSHGGINDLNGDIREKQTFVIATSSMPKKDWIRARVFSLVASLLHFNRVLQIPFILIHELCGISYQSIIEFFCDKNSLKGFEIIGGIHSLFFRNAQAIQTGGQEFIASEKWLKLLWPPDEFALIQLCTENRLDIFYQEAEQLLTELIMKRSQGIPPELLKESIQLNKYLLKQPFHKEDMKVELSYNILNFYRSVLMGTHIPLQKKKSVYQIDRTSMSWSTWEDWCREVVWYCNSIGAYMYDFVLLDSCIEERSVETIPDVSS